MTKDESLLKLKKDLMIRRYSLGTVHRYLYVVDRFLNYKNDKSVEELNEYDVIEYLSFLTSERNYKPSSYNNINAILKFFLETTLEKNIGYKRLPNAKLEVRLKITPSRELILKILKATKNLKHKCWYSLAYGSGLRTCEIAKLKVKDIDSKNMKIRVIGKGNKERLTVLSKYSLDLLLQYCRKYNITKNDIYLFKGEKKEHIHESSISRSFRDLVKRLNIDSRVTIHSLRRSFATHLLRMGVDIETVKELMGHNSITTTSSYAQVVYVEKEIKNPLDSESYEICN